MKAFELIGEVDEHHQLHVVLPDDAPVGTARVLVLVPENADVTVKATSANGRTKPKSILQIARENAMDTGIEDLAHQHDHYLRGTPKKAE